MLSDGSPITVARWSTYDTSHPQRWTTRKVGQDEHGSDLIVIEQSDGNGTFRVDVGDNPKAAENHNVLLKKADNSERQKWRVWRDYAGGESKLVKLVPYVDATLSVTLQNHTGQWDYVVLSRDISSVDRLWYFNDLAHKEIIPN